MVKNILDNLASIDTSYLLDPSVTEGNEDSESETRIKICDLVPFKNHPFHINTEDESFKQLLESIEDNGVIYPILVRPIEKGKYEIVSGHCRVEVCKLLGIEEIPAKIQDMDDLRATVVMTHTNISGRNKISISEKAKAYRMCIDMEKHQGIEGGETAAIIGAGKDSTRQVWRYVRLSYLLPEFLELIDSGKMYLQIGNELAYISESGQKAIYQFYIDFRYLPDLDQAKELRIIDNKDKLSYERIVGLLAKPIEKKTATPKISFKKDEICRFFDNNATTDEISEVIFKLLELWNSGEISI